MYLLIEIISIYLIIISAIIFISKKMNSLASIPYSFGESLIEKVYINGNEYDGLKNDKTFI
jgi:hypothetical protein